MPGSGACRTLVRRRRWLLGGVCALTIVGVAGPQVALAAASHTAYVANFASKSVTPIDTATNTAGTAITVGIEPAGVAITPDGMTAYVPNFGSNTVTPIDTATNMAGTAITVGAGPGGIAITPDGKTAYVADGNSGSVTPIDTATNTAGTAIAVGIFPLGIAITPDGNTVYVANEFSNSVTPIDTATNTAGTPITVGTQPFAIAITPDGKTAYVANFGSNTVTPIDTATNIAGTPITVAGGPIAIAITPDGKTAYVSDVQTNLVTPIDTATNTAGTAIVVGTSPRGVAIAPDGKTAYVTNFGSGTVTPIDTATNTAGTAITVGSEPIAVAVTPDQGPVAAFSAPTAVSGEPVMFDASGSSDSDGTVASYHWDFGDGTTQITSSPTTLHTYATPGNPTVTLTVTDDAGCSTAQVFTGQTVSCNGSSAAMVAHQVIVLAPFGFSSTPTTTSLASSSNPSVAGNGVTFTATVSPVPDGGTVAFTDAGTTIPGCGAVAVSTSTGQATCATSYPTAGSHQVQAGYSGDALFGGSQSPVITQTVTRRPTSVRLSSSASRVMVGRQVTYTAHVTPAPGGGHVSFFDDGHLITGCAGLPVSADGTATCPDTYSQPARHTIRARYTGTAQFANSASNQLIEHIRRHT